MTILVPNPLVQSLYPEPEFETRAITGDLDFCLRCRCVVDDRAGHVDYHRQTVAILLDLQQRIESLESATGARARTTTFTGGPVGHRS